MLPSGLELILTLETSSPGWRSWSLFLCRRKARWESRVYPHFNNDQPPSPLLILCYVPNAADFSLIKWTYYCSDDYACRIEAIEALHQSTKAQRTFPPSPLLLDSPSKRQSKRPNRLLLASSPPSYSVLSPRQPVVPPNLLLHPPEPLPGHQCRPQAFPPQR